MFVFKNSCELRPIQLYNHKHLKWKLCTVMYDVKISQTFVHATDPSKKGRHLWMYTELENVGL